MIVRSFSDRLSAVNVSPSKVSQEKSVRFPNDEDLLSEEILAESLVSDVVPTPSELVVFQHPVNKVTAKSPINPIAADFFLLYIFIYPFKIF